MEEPSPQGTRTATQKAQLNSIISRKLQKVISTEIDAEMVTALNHLSTFYEENTHSNRLNLRAQLETQCFQVHQEFLQEYSQIQEKLDIVENDILKMKERCNLMQASLDETLNTSGTLIKRADHLFQSSKRNRVQKEVVSVFLERFQLTAEQIQSLQVSTVQGVEFFNTLKEMQRIHHECHILLQSSHQNAGLEIMESMQQYMETAYKILYRWVKAECRNLDCSSPSVGNLLVCGFEALQARPVLLSYCLQEVGDTRNRAVKRNFLVALTQGGPNGMPRPIEIHAHDQYRYVTDMCAWIHQAVASESELILTLLKIPSTPNQRKYAEQPLQILNKSFLDVCVPLKARLLQVFSMKLDSDILSKLSSIIGFYKENYETLLGLESHLTKTFIEIEEHLSKLTPMPETEENEEK